MMIHPFSIARLPQIIFGEGHITQVPTHVAHYGQRVLLITGKHSFQQTTHWSDLQQALHDKQITWEHFTVSGEPSPQLVDQAVQQFFHVNIDVVLGIGGGSVLDAAKAIAGLLPFGNSVMDHLEGVGKDIPYQGPAIPFIAVPTTAGTGSEATKNAVLSIQGEHGFKKSFRHDTLMPQIAVIDPTLLSSCPPALIAADGMDAFTQLLESYVSTRANPITDALAVSGITAFKQGFFAVWENKDAHAAHIGRSQLAYASLLSGINLAQTGLGSVHGLASPLGAYFPCPHGVVCGTLVAEATDINITALQARAPKSVALDKYAHIGRLLVNDPHLNHQTALAQIVNILKEWTNHLKLPKLSTYGMQTQDIDKVVANSRGSSMKTNPVVLTDEEIRELVMRRL